MWFGSVTPPDGLSKAILQSILEDGTTPWSAKEMQDGQRQRVDISVHGRDQDEDRNPRRWIDSQLCLTDDVYMPGLALCEQRNQNNDLPPLSVRPSV